MVSLPTLVVSLIFGLVNGGIFALVSLGLSITFGLMRVINFAHGLYYAIGAFILYTVISFSGNFWLGVAVASATGFLLGVLSERLFIRYLRSRPPTFGLIATFAITLIGVDIIKIVWGVNEIPISLPTNQHVSLGGVQIPIYLFIIIGATFFVYLATQILINKTDLGLVIRAAIGDIELLQALGVNPRTAFLAMFSTGAAIAALAGALLAPLSAVDYNLPYTIILFAFATVVAGGLGSIRGSFIAGIILGESMSLTEIFYPPASVTVVFVVMAVILALRPKASI